MYPTEGQNGTRSVFLETAEERIEFQNIRMAVRRDVRGAVYAQSVFNGYVDAQTKWLIEGNAKITQGQREHNQKGWWYRFVTPRPYGHQVSTTHLMGWRWLHIDDHPDIGVPPALMSLTEYNALRKFEEHNTVEHLVNFISLEEDRNRKEYHDFSGFFRDMKPLPGHEGYSEWTTDTIPQSYIGYKKTIYDNNLPDRGKSNGLNDPDPRADY